MNKFNKFMTADKLKEIVDEQFKYYTSLQWIPGTLSIICIFLFDLSYGIN